MQSNLLLLLLLLLLTPQSDTMKEQDTLVLPEALMDLAALDLPLLGSEEKEEDEEEEEDEDEEEEEEDKEEEEKEEEQVHPDQSVGILFLQTMSMPLPNGADIMLLWYS